MNIKQLNPNQFQNLIEEYAQYEIDRMDLNELRSLVREYLVDEFKDYTPEELQLTIISLHDWETLDTLSQDLDKI